MTDLKGLPALLQRLQRMAPSELEARERRAAGVNASHFCLDGVLDQVGRFMLEPHTSDLVCQPLPPAPRGLKWHPWKQVH